jgi:thiamine-monophosphate kinase
MQIRDLGEFGVIDLLIDMAVRERQGPDNGLPFSFRLLVDSGDDAAAWRTGEATELFTTDTMVEGVHFTRVTTPWRDLGWKSMASNVSDIAAMGGLPLYALITLGLPPDTEVEDIQELYRGMLELSNKYGVAIVGGDMVRSPVVFITVSLTGVHSGQLLLRSNARPGDLVAVTGYLGTSGGGLRLMLDNCQVASEAAAYLRQGHRRPEPAVAEGRVLSSAGVMTAMDISDGLADDLSKLSRASGVSARLFAHQIPVHPLLKQAFPDQYLELALNGGEDYLLLFTASKELMALVLPQLSPAAAVVGEITEGHRGLVTIIDADGAETVVGQGGWDHYR